MAEKRFNVVFSGKLAAGAQPQQVLAELSTILKLEPGKVRELFKGGKGAVIVGDVGGQEAYRVKDDLQRAGAVCTLEELTGPSLMEEGLSGAMQSISAPGISRLPPQQGQRMQSPIRSLPFPAKKGAGMFSLVIKLALVAAVAGAGWWGYQNYLAPPTPAFQAYSQFAEYMVRGDYQKAADASVGNAREFASSWVRMTAPTTMKVYGKEYSMSPPSVSSIAGDISWIKRKRKGEKKKTDGSAVLLEVEQTVCRIPPGVASALCKWPVTFRHEVELLQKEGVWKVTEFKEERLTPQK